MAQASNAIPQFLGGEISQFAQGRFDKPDYRTSLNVCFNAFPVEAGAWVRRPGSQFAGTTRGGAPARTIKFDFEQAYAITLELSDGQMRFRNGARLITTNETQIVSGISTANPAVLNTSKANNWQTNDIVMFGNLGTSAPLLQNRQIGLVRIDSAHFSLVDVQSNAGIDGSTLGAIAAGATVTKIQDLQTPYTGGIWSSLRAVQAETTDILLHGSVSPQSLTVTTLPSSGTDPVFAINPATFNDGPYLDAFTNGVQANPSGLTGVVTITLSFQPYVATTSFPLGAFVSSGSVNYMSLADRNLGNTPASSPAWWQPTIASAAILPNGFQATDVGRLVRLFSEPDLWSVTASYIAGAVVAYNPSNTPGASTYWTALGSTTGNIPGTDTIHWSLTPANAAVWSWGRIVSLASQVSQGTGSPIGNMSNLSAPFDGTTNQTLANSAQANTSASYSVDGFVGKSFTGAPQQVTSATIYPSTDGGFSLFAYHDGVGNVYRVFSAVTINLWASQTPPATAQSGTLLGTTGSITNPTLGQNIQSNDPVTAWNYVWVEISATANPANLQPNPTPLSYSVFCGQLEFFNPPGSATSSGGINVELLGPPLLYTTPIRTWRLGVYSDTTGWPTCGCYNDGRLWLGGALPNRFDASVANGISGSTVNFAPTDQYGVVAASNAISEVLNSDSVNPIYWMEPDLQGIIMGTQAGEWLVVAPTSGSISPLNISARRVTRIGCANVEPRRTEHTTIFVQRFAKKLMEYFPDVYSGKFTAPNLADKAQHITRAGIAELAYQSSVTPIIWGRDALNALFGITYKRDALTTSQGPTFYGWHRHALGSGRSVESICVGPSVGGNLDSLTMVTSDGAMRHVEVLTDAQDELSPLSSAWFLDDAVVPTSAVSSDAPVAGAPYGGLTLNGLWHLNGKTVQVFAGGLDCGDRGTGSTGYTDFVVANGSAFVPYGDGVSAGCGGGLFTSALAASGIQIVAGFTYTSEGQLVRPVSPADSGARNGPAFGKLSRAHRYALKLVNTLGIYVGANLAKKLFKANFKQQNNQAIAPLTTFTGTHQDSFQDDYTYDDALAWRIERPFPANVVIAGTNLSTQDQ